MKEKLFNFITPNKIIFYLSWFLCFSIALPHTILPGKTGTIALLIFSLWILDGNFNEKLQILYNSKLFLSISSLILMLSLSMLWTDYSTIGLIHLSTFKYYFLLIPVLITSQTKENTLKLIHAFVLGNILHALLIIIFSYSSITLPDKITLYSPYAVYAPFFVFSLFYCFYLFRYKLNNQKIVQGLIYLSCSLFLTYIIFTNNGRSGQIAFILSTILTLVLLHKNWLKTILSFTIITILVTIISLSSKTVISKSTSAINDIANVIDNNYHGSWGARWGLLVTNFEIIKKNPILGVGIGDIQDETQRIIERGKNQGSYSIAWYDSSHNFYITILTSIGIIGFILYIFIHIYLYRLSIKQTEMKHLSLIFIIILIVTSIADNILFYKPYNIYFAIMIALFINLSLNTKDKLIENNNKL